MTDIVLGAGIVGISVALHLQARGRDVVLVDRGDPGQATSYGNAGLLERSDIMPRLFPHKLTELLPYIMGADMRGRLDWGSLPKAAPFLMRYWYESAPKRARKLPEALAPIFIPSVEAHRQLMHEADALHLLRENGWLHLYRNGPVPDDMKTAVQRSLDYGMQADILDGDEIAAREPALKKRMSAAIHWRECASLSDPGELSRLYAALFSRRGGTILKQRITSIDQHGKGWRVLGEGDGLEGQNVVVALGTWSKEFVAPLGYRIPMFTKRGYHMHYAIDPVNRPTLPIIDDENGIMISPMAKGMRMTTAIEFADPSAKPSYAQLNHAEPFARELYPLGERLDNPPWTGNRPATADMKPVIGPAPRHKGLWFAFGHAHHGLTLGPITGKILAEAMTGETPQAPLDPYLPARFD